MNDGFWGKEGSKLNSDVELTDFRNNMNARKLNVDLDTGEVKLSAPNISDIDTDELKQIRNDKLWKSAYYCPIDKNHYISTAERTRRHLPGTEAYDHRPNRQTTTFYRRRSPMGHNV